MNIRLSKFWLQIILQHPQGRKSETSGAQHSIQYFIATSLVLHRYFTRVRRDCPDPWFFPEPEPNPVGNGIKIPTFLSTGRDWDYKSRENTLMSFKSEWVVFTENGNGIESPKKYFARTGIGMKKSGPAGLCTSPILQRNVEVDEVSLFLPWY
jgi:hypothetical protein